MIKVNNYLKKVIQTNIKINKFLVGTSIFIAFPIISTTIVIYNVHKYFCINSANMPQKIH